MRNQKSTIGTEWNVAPMRTISGKKLGAGRMYIVHETQPQILVFATLKSTEKKTDCSDVELKRREKNTVKKIYSEDRTPSTEHHNEIICVVANLNASNATDAIQPDCLGITIVHENRRRSPVSKAPRTVATDEKE